MRTHRLLPLLLVAAACASAQAQGLASVPLGTYEMRWLGRTSLGLSVDRNALRVPCSTAFLCDELAVTGRASFADTPLGVYGKLGAIQGRNWGLATAADMPPGVSFGAGLSWDFSRSLSGTLGVETYSLRAGAPVRATNLGLQWRY